jgi:hypothetical protein
MNVITKLPTAFSRIVIITSSAKNIYTRGANDLCHGLSRRINNMPPKIKMYQIIRYYAPHLKRPNKIMTKNLNRAQAEAWCMSKTTRKDGEYFDGFQEQKD